VPPHPVDREAVAEAVHDGDLKVGRVIRRHDAAGGSFFLNEGPGLGQEPGPGRRAQGVVPVTEHQAQPGFLRVDAPQQLPEPAVVPFRGPSHHRLVQHQGLDGLRRAHRGAGRDDPAERVTDDDRRALVQHGDHVIDMGVDVGGHAGGVRRVAVATPVVPEHPAIRREDLSDPGERTAPVKDSVHEHHPGLARPGFRHHQVHGHATLAGFLTVVCYWPGLGRIGGACGPAVGFPVTTLRPGKHARQRSHGQAHPAWDHLARREGTGPAGRCSRS